MPTATADTITGLLGRLELPAQAEAIARARQAGIKAVGYCCPYVPVELILAHHMLPVRLDPADVAAACCPCACPAGAETANTPDLSGMLDGLVITSNGDEPRQAEEPPGVAGPALITLRLPGSQDRYRTSPGPERDFRAGLKSLERRLGRLSGKRATYIDFMRSILLEKSVRQSLRALYQAPLFENTPLAWRQAERLSRAGVGLDRQAFAAGLQGLEAELSSSEPGPADSRSRLMLYGPPLYTAAEAVLDLLERAGGVAVTDYICTASARLRKRVPVWGTLERPLESLAELYLFNAPCPFMGGYGARLERMIALARWYRVHGLVCLNPGSNPVIRADFERLSEDFYSRLFIPSLNIEDRLPLADPQGLGERLGGFIDIIGGRV